MRFTELCWVGKQIHIVMKPTNSPTKGQPNPIKNSCEKCHLGHFFPQQKKKIVGWDCFYTQTDNKKRNPSKFSANTLIKRRTDGTGVQKANDRWQGRKQNIERPIAVGVSEANDQSPGVTESERPIVREKTEQNDRSLWE